MNKFNQPVLAGLIFSLLTFSVESASNDQKDAKSTKNFQSSHTKNSRLAEEDDEYDILERNQIDNTDALAIPFDDSEVEDEEEINHLEKKDVFNLPHSR